MEPVNTAITNCAYTSYAYVRIICIITRAHKESSARSTHTRSHNRQAKSPVNLLGFVASIDAEQLISEFTSYIYIYTDWLCIQSLIARATHTHNDRYIICTFARDYNFYIMMEKKNYKCHSYACHCETKIYKTIQCRTTFVELTKYSLVAK